MKAGNQIRSVIVRNDVSEIVKMNQFLESVFEDQHIDPKISININLVMEELLSNIIYYAFNDSAGHMIEISYEPSKKFFVFKLIDDGVAFDPTDDHDTENIEKSADDRKIGGLGIHFMKSFVHKTDYKRTDNKNVLTLYFDKQNK